VANRPAQDVAARRVAIIDLIGADALAVDEIHRRLRPKAGLRTVHEDIAWLLETFPAHLSREKAAAGHGYRVVYHWQGPIPYLLSKPVGWLTEDELIALVAARGFLRDANPGKPATTGDPAPDDLLAGALGRLLDRAGVQDAAKILGRQVLTVSRFGAAPIDHACLSLALAATATGETLEFTYENLAGASRRIRALPLRCLLAKGEWYCIAWAGSLKTFRVARMSAARRLRQRPEGAPTHIPAHEVDALLASAFYATGSDRPKDRTRVTLAVSPQTWPHLRDRRWGDNQVLAEEPADLPPGWRRLAFTTTGLAECQHWVLGMGAGVRAEGPEALVEWIRQQALQLLKLPRTEASP
jgi:predicted DNA-binding transcriptional regulator YafY